MSELVTSIQGYSIHDGPGIRTVVFLKGCGLECRWCSNPECISPESEVGFVKTLCTKCGKCPNICPVGALVGFLKKKLGMKVSGRGVSPRQHGNQILNSLFVNLTNYFIKL